MGRGESFVLAGLRHRAAAAAAAAAAAGSLLPRRPRAGALTLRLRCRDLMQNYEYAKEDLKALEVRR